MSDAEQAEVPEEEPVVEEPAAEEPVSEEPAAEEEEPEEDKPAEEPVAEEKQEEPEEPEKPVEPEPEPEPEPPVEEVKEPEPVKKSEPAKVSHKRKSSKHSAPIILSDLKPDTAWKAISGKRAAALNWYVCGVTKKFKLKYYDGGNGGLEECRTYLKASDDKILFGILRVNSNDNGGSKRSKFIFIRFIGSKVGVMKKAKLSPNLGTIEEQFPVKHLTYDLSEDLVSFDSAELVKAFLRAGGAHKPDSYDFGGGVEIKV